MSAEHEAYVVASKHYRQVCSRSSNPCNWETNSPGLILC